MSFPTFIVIFVASVVFFLFAFYCEDGTPGRTLASFVSIIGWMLCAYGVLSLDIGGVTYNGWAEALFFIGPFLFSLLVFLRSAFALIKPEEE